MDRPRIDPWGADCIFEEAEGDDDHDWYPDDTSGWDTFNDAAIDRIREEKHFGQA